MPPTFLDYKSMVEHEFIVKNDDNMLLYNLRFHKKHSETIILHARSLFDLTAGPYLISSEAVYALCGQTSALEPEPEPPLDPYRPSSYHWDPEEIASQWQYNDTPRYTRESSHDPWA